jgi:hypothetical protein
MAAASTRRSYLSDEALPSEWMQYAIGSRSLPFSPSNSGVGTVSLGEKPDTLIGRLFDKASAFKSQGPDQGSSFQRFLNLTMDPEGIVERKMKVPVGFSVFSQLGE